MNEVPGAEWTSEWDDTYQCWYYYNEVTGESSWEVPAEGGYEGAGATYYPGMLVVDEEGFPVSINVHYTNKAHTPGASPEPAGDPADFSDDETEAPAGDPTSSHSSNAIGAAGAAPGALE